MKIQTSEETERVEVRARGAVAWGERASVRLMKTSKPQLHASHFRSQHTIVCAHHCLNYYPCITHRYISDIAVAVTEHAENAARVVGNGSSILFSHPSRVLSSQTHAVAEHRRHFVR